MPNEISAAKRAAWLAELAVALDEARRLTERLARDSSGLGARGEALDLCARIEAASFEVRAMRLKRQHGGENFDPKWSDDVPWKRSA